MKLYQALAHQWARAQTKNPDISNSAEDEIKKLFDSLLVRIFILNFPIR